MKLLSRREGRHYNIVMKRDLEFFEQLLADTQARIRAYIAGLGVAPHEVDDLAQDTYLELYKNLDKMPEQVEPLRWLKGVARNTCLNHFRRQARRDRLHREALVEILARFESTSEQTLAESSVHAALDRCYQKLSADNRRMLELKYLKELSAQAIAQTLETTAEAVRVALFRIRGSLKQCITRTMAREQWQ